MPTNLEIEFKTLLSMSEYETLKRRFSHVKPVRQANYYLDTPSLKLRENRLAFRIRLKKNAAEMCLKVPQDVGNIEYNIDLPLDEAKRIIEKKDLSVAQSDLSEATQLIKNAGISLADITVIGCLITNRQESQMPIGLAALDVNSYLNQNDFEFELEVQDAEQGKKDFDDFLQKNHIEFRYARSKVVRFLDTLRYHK